jgi:hypothetical protein
MLEMPVIQVNRVVDKKRIIGKIEGKEEERHKGSLPPQINLSFRNFYNNTYII